MNFLENFNIATALLALVFALPILVGALQPMTPDRAHRALDSLLGTLVLLVSLLAAVLLARLLLTQADNPVLAFLARIIPVLARGLANRELWVPLLVIAVLLLPVWGILDLLALPLRRHAVPPAAKRMASALKTSGGFVRGLVMGLWQLPKSVALVLVFAVALHFYQGVSGNSALAVAADESKPCAWLEERVVQPALDSGFVKNIRILLGDSFQKAGDALSHAGVNPLVRYFNGMTLDDAVKSNADIDAEAKKIVGTETNDRKKASLLYKWVSRNIKYDHDKAAVIARDPFKVKSGAVVAFETRKGICFDYSCLYAAMCRAVGVKVRFVTGLGYDGQAWGDHAWNQAYDPIKEEWINVDTTFGSTGMNYFDRADFTDDHADGAVQGEW